MNESHRQIGTRSSGDAKWESVALILEAGFNQGVIGLVLHFRKVTLEIVWRMNWRPEDKQRICWKYQDKKRIIVHTWLLR